MNMGTAMLLHTEVDGDLKVYGNIINTDLDNRLNDKANVTHNHTISNITDFNTQATLNLLTSDKSLTALTLFITGAAGFNSRVIMLMM